MAKIEYDNFEIKFFKKSESLGISDYVIGISSDTGIIMNELGLVISKKLEKIVIDNNWVTTYYGIFGIAYNKVNSLRPVILVVYHPTFNFKIYDNVLDIKQELAFLLPYQEV